MTGETNPNLEATKVVCSKCNGEFISYLNSNAYSIICSLCGSISNSYFGTLERSTQEVRLSELPSILPIGSKGEIKGIPYIVINHVRKKENGTVYFWDEFTLFNPIYGQAYLSVYDGHWMYLKELNAQPEIKLRIVIFEGEVYDRFAKYKSKIQAASGEFLYDFDADEVPLVQEFIQPPYLLSKETLSTNITWFKGEYILPDEIKSSFKLDNIPERKGVGMIQPFIGKFQKRTMSTVSFFIFVIWSALQFIFYFSAKEETVFSKQYFINDANNRKEIYTSGFELSGGTSNAEIKINTNIDNNWMYSAITLVNEKTGDIYDLDLEAEYYHGYEDGSSWSEGKSWISKVVSKVPDGSYYLIVYPDKPATMNSVDLTVSVTRNVFMFSNGLIILLLLALFPTYYFFRKNSFEQKRWFNSNYSTYE